jgi:hypothetical protein
MKTRLIAAAAIVAFALVLQGCSSQQASDASVAGYTPYPKWFGQPYSYAPYDPAGTYYFEPYQYPYPYYYSGYYDHDCGDVPCDDQRKYWHPALEARAEPVTIPQATAPASPPAPTAAPPASQKQPR